MVLKAYTNFSDSDLIEHLSQNLHYQLFCDVQIDPLHPLTNFKIVSAIRQELSERLDIESLQEVLAGYWKPYMENLHVCMTDATCYESHMRYPTDVKLLWESVEWLHRHLCEQCRILHMRCPRNKYDDVSRAYLSYSKRRKRKTSHTRMLKQRLIHLLGKLINQTDELHRCHGKDITLSRDYQNDFQSSGKFWYKQKNCLQAGKYRTVL